MSNLDLNSLWQKTQDLLVVRGCLDRIVLTTFFQDAKLVSVTDSMATLCAQTQVSRSVLLQELNNIRIILSELTEKPLLNVEILLMSDYLQQFAPVASVDSVEEDSSNLNPDYVFDNFVEGPSNRESYIAALTCASNPKGFVYCPLYIYGDSGLGKTHLMHAIGNKIKADHPEMKIQYMTSDDFISAVVKASHEKKLAELKEQFMQLDVLLLDDIQFLSGGKLTSSETLFNIYNQLQRKKKLIVITSDKKPWEIKELEERLVSRLSNGLTCCIDSPEYETAMKILKMKLRAHADDLVVEEEALSLIAQNFSHDVRALEGRLNRLIFYSLQFGFNDKVITYDLAKEAFKDDISAADTKNLSIASIQKTVADYYGLTKLQLISKTKTKLVSDARSIAIYICRQKLDAPFTRIGDEFGRRDHSTIMTAYKKIETKVTTDVTLQIAIKEIEKRL